MQIKGKYHNSKSAQLSVATLTFGPHFLSFVVDELNHSWKYSEIKVEKFGSDEFILRRGEEYFCIHIDDWENIAQFFPKKRFHFDYPIYLYIGLIAGLVSLYYFLIPIISNQVALMIPQDLEESLGEQFIAAVVGDEEDCSQRMRKKFVEDLLKEMKIREDYRILIIDDPMANAFAIPGRIIAITTGAIDIFENENQIVGVLAHEIQHHRQRHHIRRIVKMAFTTILWNVSFSSITGYASFDPELLKTIATSSYNAEDEKEADLLAAKMLKERNISAQGLGGFLEALNKKYPSNAYVEKIFSSHPVTEDRVQYLKEASADNIQDKSLLPKERWDELKKGCVEKERPL